MEDQEQDNSVNEEVAPPQDTEIHAQEQKQEANTQEDSQNRNWAELRKQKQDLEKKLQSQQELLENVLRMQQANMAGAPQAIPEVDELDQIDADEYIPKGKVEQLVAKRAAQIARQEAEAMFAKREQGQFMQKLKVKYADFDDVVNADTIAHLEITDPELAETIAELKDPYKMGVQSYKYIKALNLSKKPESKRAKETLKKIEENEKFVQSPMSYDKRPMATAFQISDKEKQDLYAEMMRFASGV